jgi:hypothetical protein
MAWLGVRGGMESILARRPVHLPQKLYGPGGMESILAHRPVHLAQKLYGLGWNGIHLAHGDGAPRANAVWSGWNGIHFPAVGGESLIRSRCARRSAMQTIFRPGLMLGGSFLYQFAEVVHFSAVAQTSIWIFATS